MRRTEARARLQSANLAFCAKLNTFRQLFFRRSRCTIHSDLPTTAVTRADYRARNNWDFDTQGIECNADACSMNSFDTCNSSFHLNHVRRFQLRSIAHIACSGADLKRQGEFSDVDVTIDITSTLLNVIGKVIVLLHLNGSTHPIHGLHFRAFPDVSHDLRGSAGQARARLCRPQKCSTCRPRRCKPKHPDSQRKALRLESECRFACLHQTCL